MFKPTDKYLIKSIRADENDYFREFLLQCTRTPSQQHKFALRWGAKGLFTVTGEGVFERLTKRPQYTQAEKLEYSKSTSTSLVTPEITVPVFGHSRKTGSEKLVGMMFLFNNIKFTKRFYKYDGGTVERPYDHPTKEAATQYARTKINTVLFSELAPFEQALIKDNNPLRINEVLARVKWSNDGRAALFIATDNLESRLIAQDRARILLARLQEQVAELSTPWDTNYQVPIYFYAPGEASHLRVYAESAQACDRRAAQAIFSDPIQRAEKDAAGNFEYLLAIDNPRDQFSEGEWNALIKKLSSQGNILWSLLEKMPFYQQNPAYECLLKQLMINKDADEDQGTINKWFTELHLLGAMPVEHLTLKIQLARAVRSADMTALHALLIPHEAFDASFINKLIIDSVLFGKTDVAKLVIDKIAYQFTKNAGLNRPSINEFDADTIKKVLIRMAIQGQDGIIQYFIDYFKLDEFFINNLIIDSVLLGRKDVAELFINKITYQYTKYTETIISRAHEFDTNTIKKAYLIAAAWGYDYVIQYFMHHFKQILISDPDSIHEGLFKVLIQVASQGQDGIIQYFIDYFKLDEFFITKLIMASVLLGKADVAKRVIDKIAYQYAKYTETIISRVHEFDTNIIKKAYSIATSQGHDYVIQYFIHHFKQVLISDPDSIRESLFNVAKVSEIQWLKLDSSPTQMPFEALAPLLAGRNTLVLFNNDFYYVNYLEQTVTKRLTPDNPDYLVLRYELADLTIGVPQLVSVKEDDHRIIRERAGQPLLGRLALVEAIFSLLKESCKAPSSLSETDYIRNVISGTLAIAAGSGHLNLLDYLLNKTGIYKLDADSVGRALEEAGKKAQFESIQYLINLPEDQKPSSVSVSKILNSCCYHSEAITVVHALLNLPEQNQADAASISETLITASCLNLTSIAEAILNRKGVNKPNAVAVGNALVHAASTGNSALTKIILSLTGEYKPTQTSLNKALFAAFSCGKYELFDSILRAIPPKEQLAVFRIRDPDENTNLLHQVLLLRYPPTDDMVAQLGAMIASLTEAERSLLVNEPISKCYQYPLDLALKKPRYLKILLENLPVAKRLEVIMQRMEQYEPESLLVLLDYLFKDTPKLCAAYNELATQLSQGTEDSKKLKQKLDNFMCEVTGSSENNRQAGFFKPLATPQFSISGYELSQDELRLVAGAITQQLYPILIPTTIDVQQMPGSGGPFL